MPLNPGEITGLKLSTFFKYRRKLRRVIYTTNAIENYHRSLRKVTKAKSVFGNDTSLMKILYLATMEITKKWTERMKYWAIILSQLNIYFKERIESYVV